MGSLTVSREFERIQNADMNWKMPTPTVHWSMSSVLFYLHCQEMNDLFYLNFYFYLSASQPQIVTQGGDELQGRVVITSNICTCSSEGNEVCIVKQNRAFVRNHLNWCVSQWLVSFCFVLFFLVLAWNCKMLNIVLFRPIVCQSTHQSPLSFAASNHWQRGFISQTDISTKQETDDFFFFLYCFVLMGHTALPQQGVFHLCLSFSWQYVTLLSVCLSVWKKKIAGIQCFSDVF